MKKKKPLEPKDATCFFTAKRRNTLDCQNIPSIFWIISKSTNRFFRTENPNLEDIILDDPHRKYQVALESRE